MSGPGDKKDKFFKPQSKLGENFKFFFRGMLAKTGLTLQIQVTRVFRRSKVLLRIVPPSLDTSLLMLRRSLRIQSSASVLLVWSVCCASKPVLQPLLAFWVNEIWLRIPRFLLVSLRMISVLWSVSGAHEIDDSSEEFLVHLAMDSTATGKHDLEDGIVAVCNDSSVPFSVGRALDSSVTGTCDLDGVPVVRASSPATAGDGNRSRLLEVIESVFPCLVTRFANSPNSSLRVSSHARARALCFAAASAFRSDPHSAHHSLPALTDVHADD